MSGTLVRKVTGQKLATIFKLHDNRSQIVGEPEIAA
jgi:hypothetical protein